MTWQCKSNNPSPPQFALVLVFYHINRKQLEPCSEGSLALANLLGLTGQTWVIIGYGWGGLNLEKMLRELRPRSRGGVLAQHPLCIVTMNQVSIELLLRLSVLKILTS